MKNPGKKRRRAASPAPDIETGLTKMHEESAALHASAQADILAYEKRTEAVMAEMREEQRIGRQKNEEAARDCTVQLSGMKSTMDTLLDLLRKQCQ